LAATAVALCAVTVSGYMTASWLLVLVFANGIGLALRLPVFAAIVPELVPRSPTPGSACPQRRCNEPFPDRRSALAGAIIASAGSAWVFALSACLSLLSGFLVLRWRYEHVPNPLGKERLASAIRVGVQYVRQSPRMRAVLLRVSVFFLHSMALLGLLPLVARGLPGGDAGTFTLLLASMGSGAILAVLGLPRLRQRFGRDELVVGGAVVQSAAAAVVAIAPNAWVAVLGMVAAGMAWITVANTLSVSAQMSLPNWVRARAMASFQMAIMGSGALGAALWGQVATVATIRTALLCAAVSEIVLMLLVVRLVRDHADEEADMSPAQAGWAARPSEEPQEDGRVVTTIEYLIDPVRENAFVRVMQETRRARLSEGAIGWELLHDIAEPARFVEEIVDESWTERLRRFTVPRGLTLLCASVVSHSTKGPNLPLSRVTSFGGRFGYG
jgi:MFS family permease